MNRWILGAVFIVLGVLIAVGPVTIFPVCGEGLSRSAAAVSDAQTTAPEATAAPMAGTQAGEEAAAPREMSSPMKCHWTARAELGVGLLIVLLGLLLFPFSSKEARLGLSLALAPAGILALLIPVWLIGVCGNAHMSCHALALPALTVLGGATAFLALVNAVWLSFSARKRQAQA